VQEALLCRWAPRVKPGGKLAYVTCSVLRQENEQVAEAFSSAHPDFAPLPSQWAAQCLPAHCIDGAALHIDPVSTETDAFFLALWQRR
jgi:16S rRNA (cytosine967-C5)-methyltransferase